MTTASTPASPCSASACVPSTTARRPPSGETPCGSAACISLIEECIGSFVGTAPWLQGVSSDFFLTLRCQFGAVPGRYMAQDPQRRRIVVDAMLHAVILDRECHMSLGVGTGEQPALTSSPPRR